MLSAWPALRQVHDGDWLWRFGQGYTKRANSLNVLDPADGQNASERLDNMARMSAEAGIRFVVRTSPLTPPEVLDELEQRGMVPFEESIVMLRSLAQFTPSLALGPSVQQWQTADLEDFHAACHTGAAKSALHLFAGPVSNDSWLVPQIHLSHYDTAKAQGLRAICAAITAPAIGLTLFDEAATPVASCIVVIVEGIAFLNNVVTAPTHRRKGYGRTLLNHALQMGVEHGAHWAAHPVVASNMAARGLYERMGYAEAYRYVYFQAA